jgi:hypothetical protein
MKSTQGIPIYLKIVKATRRWGSKKIFNGLHQLGDKKEQIIDYWKAHRGGASPPKAFSAQPQDNLGEWFLIGLTFALVVRKRRGLR